jgi:hypothetical protein
MIDWPRRSSSFNDLLAGRAGELRPHVLNHFEGSRDAFQLLGNIFAELTQRATTIRTAALRGKMRDDFTRKIFWQRLARNTTPRLGCSRRRTGLCRFACGLLGLQFFQLKLKLFQLPLQLLALAAEDHPPVLLDNQLQMFDLLMARFVLRNHQRLQCFDIKRIQIRQWSRNHACSMA